MTKVHTENVRRNGLALQGAALLFLLMSPHVKNAEILAGLLILLEGMRLARACSDRNKLFDYYRRELSGLVLIWLLTVVPGYVQADLLRHKLGAGVFAGDVFFGSYIMAGQDRFWIFPVILIGALLMPVFLRGSAKRRVTVLRLIFAAEGYAILLFLLWAQNKEVYGNLHKMLLALPLLVLGAWMEKRWPEKMGSPAWLTAIAGTRPGQMIGRIFSGLGSVWLFAWMNHMFLWDIFHEPDTWGYYLFLTVLIAIGAAFVQRGILIYIWNRERIPYAGISEYRGEIMGIAIIAITATHYANHVINAGLEKTEYVRLIRMFPCFVDVFMIISGLGMYYSFRRDSRIRRFYSKRLVKLIPVYVLVGTLSWMHWDILKGHGGLPQLIKDFTFQTMVTDKQYRFWFIPAILCCYLLVPVVYRGLHLLKNRTLSWILMEILIFAAFAGLRAVIPEIYGNITIALERFPVFVTGMYFGERCYEKKGMNPRIAVLIALAASLGQQFVRTQTGVIPKRLYYPSANVQGIFLIIAAVMIMEVGRRWKAIGLIQKSLRVIGGATLEIYLLHMSIKSVAGNPYDPLMYTLTCMLLPIVLGLGLHYVSDYLFPSGK